MQYFDARTEDVTAAVQAKLETKLERDPKVHAAVAEIIARVATEGDTAVAAYTQQFDGHDISATHGRVEKAALQAAFDALDPALKETLTLSTARIREYHEKQKPQDHLYEDDLGNTLGWKWTAMDAAGLYVPGGLAAYPSSVLMNAIPAQVAGVSRIVVTVPAPNGTPHPVVLAACHMLGIEEVYTIGGAQAIAALAYGTKHIAAVDVIVGPGNAYVAAAKQQVYGIVGIDMIAGPSEILVVADGTANTGWVAADLLSQAEHDTAARSVLITTEESLAGEVEAAVEAQLQALPREDIARASWEQHSMIILVKDLKQAAEYANVVAAEHTELCVAEPEALAEHITHAGALFLGHYTCESLGDYMAGPSHVLPTSGAARFSSGLGVYDFMKRSSIIGASKKGFAALAPHTARFAESEGLQAHANAVLVRSNEV